MKDAHTRISINFSCRPVFVWKTVIGSMEYVQLIQDVYNKQRQKPFCQSACAAQEEDLDFSKYLSTTTPPETLNLLSLHAEEARRSQQSEYCQGHFLFSYSDSMKYGRHQSSLKNKQQPFGHDGFVLLTLLVCWLGFFYCLLIHFS